MTDAPIHNPVIPPISASTDVIYDRRHWNLSRLKMIPYRISFAFTERFVVQLLVENLHHRCVHTIFLQTHVLARLAFHDFGWAWRPSSCGVCNFVVGFAEDDIFIWLSKSWIIQMWFSLPTRVTSFLSQMWTGQNSLIFISMPRTLPFNYFTILLRWACCVISFQFAVLQLST